MYVKCNELKIVIVEKNQENVQMTSDRFIEGKLSQFVAYCAFRVLSAYIFEDYMQKAGFHVAKFNHRHSR